MQRRPFLRFLLFAAAGTFGGKRPAWGTPAPADLGTIRTVRGAIAPGALGTTLIHEHVLVDFIGADQITPDRWNRAEVVERVLPYLLDIKALGVESLIECTPAYLGRDPALLRELSEKSGLHLLTNTGYYAAAGNKFLPPQAFTETAGQLAERWIAEAREGIEGTSVRPGFQKISVNAPDGKIDRTDRKLIRAAGLTHRATGLTIASHTGLAAPAREQLDELRDLGVHPSAFIWVHAQAQGLSTKNLSPYLELGRRGCWISLDGVADDTVLRYAELLEFLKSERLLGRVLLSHDAGWYRPGEANGGEFRPFTTIHTKLVPELRKRNFAESDIRRLLVRNPAEAFTIRVRAQ
jgi:phosphotriesterase-related protein